MSRILVELAIAASICVAQDDPFQSHVNIPAGDGTGSLAIADFNGDGKKDIAVINTLINTITVLLGDGKGEFAPAPGGVLHFTTDRQDSEPLATGDFNGDGKIDLAYTEHSGVGSAATMRIQVRFGNGDGTFLSSPIVSTAIRVSRQLVRLVAADMNNDGKLDLAGDYETIFFSVPIFEGSIYLGDNTGAFQPDEIDGSTAIGDFNQDGRLDYASGWTPSSYEVFFSNSLGGYDRTVAGGLSSPGASQGVYRAIAGDYNADGSLDLLVLTGANSPSSGQGNVWGLQGGGTNGFFVEFRMLSGVIPGNGSVFAVGDFNGDGILDWAVGSGGNLRIGLLRASTSLGFSEVANLSAAPQLADMKAADLDGDGMSDLILSNGWDLDLWLTKAKSSLTPQTITFDPVPDRTVDSASFAPPVSASSGLPVMLTSNSPGICEVVTNVVTVVGGGLCVLRASQPGNDTIKAAEPVYRFFNISLLPQIISVAQAGPLPVGTPPFRLQATASSGLPLAVTASRACSAYGNVIQLIREGTCTLYISQTGSATYGPVSTSMNIRVTPGTPQPEVILFAPLPDVTLSIFTAVSIDAVVTSSGRVATLTSDTPDICSVSNNDPPSFGPLNPGTCSITASLGASPPYLAANPVTQTFQILPAEKIPLVIASAVPPQSNVSLATGSFSIGFGTSVGPGLAVVSNTPTVCSYVGSVIRFLGPGMCSVTASHPGNNLYLPGSRTVSFNIVDGPTEIRSIVFPGIADYALGTPPLKLAVTANPPGSAAVRSNTPGICELTTVIPSSPLAGVPYTAITLLSLGTCSLTATLPGDRRYLEAAPITRTFNIIPGSGSQTQSISVETFIDYQIVSSAFYDVVVTATSGLPVDLSSQTSSICGAAGMRLSLLAPGKCVITASQPGNSVFQAAMPEVFSFEIRGGRVEAQTLGLTPVSDRSLGTPSFPLVPITRSTLPITYQSYSSACSISGNIVTLLRAGHCSITASLSGDATHAPAYASVGFFVLSTPTIQSIQNGASHVSGALAPSSIGTIRGTSFLISPIVTLRDSKGDEYTLEQTLTGDPQIDVLVPTNVALGPATIKVSNANGAAEYQVTIAATSPGLFSIFDTGQGPAMAQIEVVTDNTSSYYNVTERTLLIPPGGDVFITLEATGVRGHGLNGVSGRIAGIPVQVLSSGAHPSTPGVDLVKLGVPRASIEQGTVDIRIAVDGVDSNIVTASFGEPRSRYTRSR